jgi:cell division protein FtsI (penicillin-binding protein 3)
MTSKFIRLRLLIVGLVFTAGFTAIAGKALMLQITQGPWLSRKASDQVEDQQRAFGKRGTIFDRRGREMALSVDVVSIAVRPARIENSETAARKLAAILKRPAAEMKARLASNKPFVWVKRQATPKEVEAVRRLNAAGIEFISESNRFYPNRTLAAQLIGFTGLDGKGLEGVEFFYDSHLRGTGTDVRGRRDALGNRFQSEPAAEESANGKNLVLTLDQGIQFAAETALAEAVGAARARSGMAVVMEPQTGAILALALAPTFNPNAYEEASKPLWRNRAVTDPFEPGSTLKIFLAAAALEHTDLSPLTRFNCENGAYRIGRHTVRDVHHHGTLTFQEIIKFSSNIGAAKIGERVGPEKLHRTLQAFGFGQKTGIDSPGETAGLLMPPRKWKEIDIAAISFGHGVSVSAIQLVSAVSAIANDGILMKPRIVESVTDRQGRVIASFGPTEVRRAVSRATARRLKEVLQAVVMPGGTGILAALEGYPVCGKTGTARKVDESGRYASDRHLASFAGFAPADEPRVAVLVVIDEPRGKITGGEVAAPVFKQIARSALNILNVPPRPATEKLRVSWESGGRG